MRYLGMQKYNLYGCTILWALPHCVLPVGLGWVYFFQPASGFGPYFLAWFGSGKKCFYSGLPRVKIIGQFRVQSLKEIRFFLI